MVIIDNVENMSTALIIFVSFWVNDYGGFTIDIPQDLLSAHEEIKYEAENISSVKILYNM